MRKINKNPEPKEWTSYRLTPGADYKAIPELRRALLEEQGYICAYCMRRIPVKDSNSNETSRIEHILCRGKHDDEKLHYTNMVVCCPGAINHHFHCDKSKDENDVTFDLFSDYFFTTLSYQSKDGKISSSNKEYNSQMNQLLNLNNPLLMENRHSTLKGVIGYLDKKGWSIANISRMIDRWDNKDVEGCYKEYCGIVVWFLKKKLKLIRNQ